MSQWQLVVGRLQVYFFNQPVFQQPHHHLHPWNHPPTPPSKKTTEYPPTALWKRSLLFFCVIVALFLFVDFPYFHQKKICNPPNKKNGHLFGFYLAQTPKKIKKESQKKIHQQKTTKYPHLSQKTSPTATNISNHLHLHGNQQRIRLTTGKFRHALTPEFDQARRLGRWGGGEGRD